MRWNMILIANALEVLQSCTKSLISYWWLSASLTYLQCYLAGDTIVLHQAIDMMSWRTLLVATLHCVRQACLIHPKYRLPPISLQQCCCDLASYWPRASKQDYFKNKIELATSTKELFKVCNNLLNRTNENVLPSHSCATELANRFVNYFGDKIKSIRRDLEDSFNAPDYTINVANDFDGVPLDKFRIVSQEEVRKIISSSPRNHVLLTLSRWRPFLSSVFMS